MEKALIPVSDRVVAVVDDVRVDLGSRCVLLRRRFRKTLRDASVATGFHEHRLSEMERGLREVDPLYVAFIGKLVKSK